MQLSEIYRRGVVTPLDDDAADQLSIWSAPAMSAVVFLPISSDSFFYDIWRNGVFHDLNRVCSTFIDDYEEECISPNKLGPALKVLHESLEKAQDTTMRQFLADLISLCESAERRNYPVYFVL